MDNETNQNTVSDTIENCNTTNEVSEQNTINTDITSGTIVEASNLENKTNLTLNEKDDNLTNHNSPLTNCLETQDNAQKATMDSNNCGDNEKNKINKEPQEEDVPESFFDDLMSEEFMEGLNVVDTWEGDEVTQNSADADLNENTENGKQLPGSIRPPTTKDASRNNKDKVLNDKHADKRKRDRKKDRNNKYQSKKVHSSLKNKESGTKKRSSSQSKGKISDSGRRRDPNKTQRDILRDKDKCEKDKSAKILHEKLKVVETGLVPPGMEMEVDIQSSVQIPTLEEGEIIPESEAKMQKKMENKGVKQNKNTSRKNQGISRKAISPIRRRDLRVFKPFRSRFRSPQTRLSPHKRSRSIERRVDRKRKSLRRTRSRSIDRERKRKYRSPLRNTSPLVKRNEQLFKELDLLRARLFPGDVSRLQSPLPRDMDRELMQAHMAQSMHVDIANTDMSHYNSNPVHFPPVSNQNLIPIQPVPPPHQPSAELDHQFFIGQPSFEPSNYSVPMQPQLLQGSPMIPLNPSNLQHNFQQNWHIDQSSEAMNFFHSGGQFGMEQHNFQGSMGLPTGYLENMEDVPPQTPFAAEESLSSVPTTNSKNEEDMFAKVIFHIFV